MKKIPTLFERTYENGKSRAIPVVKKGFEGIINGEGEATIKYDGACCAIIDGVFYKRYDCKKGKPIPAGAILCQETADPITGHLPCWVRCDRVNPSDKWFWSAYDNTAHYTTPADLDGTYECVGVHFQGNPYRLGRDYLIKHGNRVVNLKDRSFENIKKELQGYADDHIGIEGFVFWKNGEPVCKIKSSDFGINWKKDRFAGV